VVTGLSDEAGDGVDLGGRRGSRATSAPTATSGYGAV